MQSAQNEWAQVATSRNTLGYVKQKQQMWSSIWLAVIFYSGISVVLTSMTYFLQNGTIMYFHSLPRMNHPITALSTTKIQFIINYIIDNSIL